MPKFQENISLAKISTYKIGGPARFFFEPKNEKEVIWAAHEARVRKLSIFIFGGGTNLLIDDRGWDGLVLRPNILVLKIGGKSAGTELIVGASVLMSKLLNFSAKKSLSGLEWAGGLPGTLGGAIRGNAGCFGGEMKDVVELVRSFDMKTMKIVERSARECGFGYRASVFKKDGGDEIILGATLRMRKGDKKEIAKSIAEKIEHRKRNHPLDYPNIGSIFKNVPLAAIHKEGSKAHKQAVEARTLTFRGSTFSVKNDPFPVISAAKLISESGLRGVSHGGAMISAKHPNFIVNVLGARAPDVRDLITLVKIEVKKKFDVELEEEIRMV